MNVSIELVMVPPDFDSHGLSIISVFFFLFFYLLLSQDLDHLLNELENHKICREPKKSGHLSRRPRLNCNMFVVIRSIDKGSYPLDNDDWESKLKFFQNVLARKSSKLCLATIN